MAVIVVEHIFQGDRNLEDLLLWIIPVTVQFNDIRRSVNVLLDTGAQKTVFSPDLSEWLDLPENQSSIQGSGATGSSSYEIAKIDRLEIGSILFSETEVLFGSLPGVSSKYYIDGILGGDILKELKVILDYPQKTLKLEKLFISL
jgi:predicted aspartyl protease